MMELLTSQGSEAPAPKLIDSKDGEMAEWLKAAVC
jgi:hypothetical protein